MKVTVYLTVNASITSSDKLVNNALSGIQELTARTVFMDLLVGPLGVMSVVSMEMRLV
jgi:hypothetical protein